MIPYPSSGQEAHTPYRRAIGPAQDIFEVDPMATDGIGAPCPIMQNCRVQHNCRVQEGFRKGDAPG